MDMRRVSLAVAFGLLLCAAPAWALTPTPEMFWDDGYVDDAPTMTPTPTATPIGPTVTITRTPTKTGTPTSPPGCHQVTVSGVIFDTSGAPAANQRVSVTIPRPETVSGTCTLRPGTTVYHTDANGFVPGAMKVVAGSEIMVSLQNGGPTQACVPQNITAITIFDLLNSSCHP